MSLLGAGYDDSEGEESAEPAEAKVQARDSILPRCPALCILLLSCQVGAVGEPSPNSDTGRTPWRITASHSKDHVCLLRW